MKIRKIKNRWFNFYVSSLIIFVITLLFILFTIDNKVIKPKEIDNLIDVTEKVDDYLNN
jgi:hypothetical protein